MQGVVAGSRVYHQRRHSGFPGDTWPDQPCVSTNFSEMGRGSTQAPPRRLSVNFDVLQCCRILDFFGYLQLVQLHQNLPQSKDVEVYFALKFTLDQPIFPGSF